MTPEQTKAVGNYLKARFGKENIELRSRKLGSGTMDDSVEVWMDNEILGLLYVDDEDKDDVSYDLNISILQDDLSGGMGA